jgi:hypothetical protein
LAKATLELELAVSPTRSGAVDSTDLTVAELLLAYLEHASQHYRGPEGQPTSEIYEVKVVARALRDL